MSEPTCKLCGHPRPAHSREGLCPMRPVSQASPTPPVPSAAEEVAVSIGQLAVSGRAAAEALPEWVQKHIRHCRDFAYTTQSKAAAIATLDDALTAANAQLAQVHQERTELLAAYERMTAHLAQVQGERDEAADYTITLQRIIEALCHGRQLPANVQEKAPHHAAMASAYIDQLAAQAPVIQAVRVWSEGRTLGYGPAADKLLEAIRAHDATLSPAVRGQEENNA